MDCRELTAAIDELVSRLAAHENPSGKYHAFDDAEVQRLSELDARVYALAESAGLSISTVSWGGAAGYRLHGNLHIPTFHSSDGHYFVATDNWRQAMAGLKARAAILTERHLSAAAAPAVDGNRPHCVSCGALLAAEDARRSHCASCRSPKGKLMDLSIAIRSVGDSPDRIRDWSVIRHWLRQKFGQEHSPEELFSRFTDWLQAEMGLRPNEYLQLPLERVRSMLEPSRTREGATAGDLGDTPPAGGSAGERVESDLPAGATSVQPAGSTKDVRPKKSMVKGEARAKLIAALTLYHQYADGGRLNEEPIGNNELARKAGVDRATASAFFKQQFKGYEQYKVACRSKTKLVASLKLLNGDFSPHHLYGGKPAGEDHRDDE